MNNTRTNDSRHPILGGKVLLGIASVLVLMLYGILRYPSDLGQSYMPGFLASVITLLAYAGAAQWTRGQTSDPAKIALSQGAKLGLLLAIAAILNHCLEVFANLDASVSAILGVSMWGLMFLLFGAAGSATYRQVHSLRLAVISSVWCALISTIAILLSGYAIALLFMPHMQQILAGAYAQHTSIAPEAFVIQNTLSSGLMHALLAPLVAALFGFAGGCACALLQSIHRSIAVTLGVLEILLLGVGLFAIQFASSLNRPERPPFIMGGLLALGLAMACAHPILTAIRYRSDASH